MDANTVAFDSSNKPRVLVSLAEWELRGWIFNETTTCDEWTIWSREADGIMWQTAFKTPSIPDISREVCDAVKAEQP
jgi:hypothetical protein